MPEGVILVEIFLRFIIYVDCVLFKIVRFVFTVARTKLGPIALKIGKALVIWFRNTRTLRFLISVFHSCYLIILIKLSFFVARQTYFTFTLIHTMNLRQNNTNIIKLASRLEITKNSASLSSKRRQIAIKLSKFL